MKRRYSVDQQSQGKVKVVKTETTTEFPFKVAKIGVRNQDQCEKGGFLFENEKYRLLIGSDLLTDISLVPEFGLKMFCENENEVALWVILKSNLFRYCDKPYPNVEAAKHLIDEFFIVNRNNLFDEKDDTSEDPNEKVDYSKDEIDKSASSLCEQNYKLKSFASIVEHLYTQLQAAHAIDDCSHTYNDKYIQHESLLVNLKAYQIRTVKWMLHREQVLKWTNGFVEIRKRSNEDESMKYFYDSKTISLTADPEEFIALPTGGILAEEMGLGKTIEILDLILLNPRPLGKNQCAEEKNEQATGKPNSKDVKCVCGQIKTTDTIRCTRCSKLQHRKCVSHKNSEITPDNGYICLECWRKEKPIDAKTTFVVSPRSIKLQWKSETDNRIQGGKISLLVYAGSKKWINPIELASYDIILTDYETLRSEFFYSDLNSTDRKLRKTTTEHIMKLHTPLLCLNFWRVCLDESQMVTEMKTNHAQMAFKLSAVHRWAVTGTPIESSFDDLFGLISFINYEPFNEYSRWRNVVSNLTYKLNFEAVVSMLQPIMWRTCKSQTIMDQMSVPKQTEQLHFVEISNLNRYHYKEERDNCRNRLHQLISTSSLDTPLANLSPSYLTFLLEPVRILRRNCSILHVSDKAGNTIIMQPRQMLHHLINTNESDAKSMLQKIASRLKSLVAFSIGTHKQSAYVSKSTLGFCRNVLEWAKNYENESTMIESLFQIRVIHNVILMDKKMNEIDLNKCNADLSALEAQFHSRHFDLITKFQTERQKETEKFADFETFFIEHIYEWATTALNQKTSQAELFMQVRNKINSSYENVGPSIATIVDISRVLLFWSTNLLHERKNLKIAFAELNIIAIKTESKYGKEAGASEFFLKLLNSAIDCHGTDDLDDDSEERPSKKVKKECRLCSIKKQLGTYAVYISDNAHRMIRSCTGSTNPSFQESILKAILQANDYAGNINTKDGIDLLTVLENLRDEFQKYKEVLHLITKSIASYHKVQQRKPLKATTTPPAIEELWNVIKMSEIAYVRKIRTTRYLKCLGEDNEIEECAICMTPFINRYVVFECGHQSCETCFNQITNSYQFNCPFCRETFLTNSAHHFSIEDQSLTNSSSKMEHIIREVLNLKQQDPKVKILIFSQWSDILNTLKKQLFTNEIPNRSITSARTLHKIVQEFKDPRSNITCLLMPYVYGSKGLNLTEATHVFLVEPILNRGEELQSLGRVHRIGQTRETYVHRFITKNTIEETIYKAMSTEASGILSSEKCTVKTLLDLFADTDDSFDGLSTSR